jgi:FkbM family methyltransferase
MQEVEKSPSLWPEMKGLKGKYVEFLLKFSFFLRRHPIRLLYNDSLLKAAGTLVPGEIEVFQKKWNGPVWDVGASIGKYATILAKTNPDQLVYAFEPNLNSLYYLGYRTSRYKNVVVVPMAVTLDGAMMQGNYDPDFLSGPRGPLAASLSIEEAVKKFGRPAFAKFDIEGGEFTVFKNFPEALRGASLLIEWHPYIGKSRPYPIPGYRAEQIGPETHSVTFFYTPV